MILMLSSNVCPWTSYGITNLYYNIRFLLFMHVAWSWWYYLEAWGPNFLKFFKNFFLMFKNNKGI